MPRVALLIACLLPTGCSTLVSLGVIDGDSTLRGRPAQVYGGVRYSVKNVSELWKLEHPEDEVLAPMLLPIHVADFVLSSAADTLLLPYTIFESATAPDPK
jgi:uncharacterized protein YceK